MAVVIALVGVLIFVVIHTTFGGTVISQTDTRACLQPGASANLTSCGLENGSTIEKTMYSLEGLVYAIFGVIVLISAGFGLGKKF